MKNGLNIEEDGTKRYYLNDELHREDGPACEHSNGIKSYWKNGKFHRDGGLPAIEYPNGDKSYLINGKYHREDGPAIEHKKGIFYYLDGSDLEEQNYWKEIKKRKSLGYILSNIKKELSK